MNDADNSLPASGLTLTRALKSLVETLNEKSVRYAVIGGIAAIQHGRVRTTSDIDVLLIVPQIAMPALFDALRDKGFAIDLKRNIKQLREDGMTTFRFGDVMIDIMRPVLPVYSHVLDRAVSAEIFGQPVRLCAVEGLIVMKLIAFRPQDEADLRELIDAYRGELDLDYVRSEFATVAEPNDPRWLKLEGWLKG